MGTNPEPSQCDTATTSALSVHELIESARSLERIALRSALSSIHVMLGDWSDGHVRGLRDAAVLLRCQAASIANPSDRLTIKAWRYIHGETRAG